MRTNGIVAAPPGGEGYRGQRRRSGAVRGKDQGWSQPYDSLRGQLPKIADIRLRAERVLRIQARGIDSNHPLVLAEGVENLGDGAANRHHSRRIRNRNVAAGCIANIGAVR